MKKKNTRIRRRKYNSRKKFIFPLICLCILLGVSVIGVFATVGDSFTVDEYTYEILTEEYQTPDDETTSVVGGTVKITKYSGDDPEEELPSKVSYDVNGDSNPVEFTVTEIGSQAFKGNTSLTKLSFPANNKITDIGERAFQECSALATIDFTNATELTKIGEAAFDKCKKLGTELDLNPAVKLEVIDTYAFKECSRLRNVKLDKTALTKINNTAFSNCINLRKVSLPETIETIGKKAFYNCPWLTGFPTLSDSVSVGEGAFWGCCYISPDLFPEGSDPFDADTVLQYLDAQLRGVSITKIIPSDGEEDTSVTNTSYVPRRFFKGQGYDITFDPADDYKIKGLDLLTREEGIPTTYSISSEFSPDSAGGTEYKFDIPADWNSTAFVIFAAATKELAESGAPTILTKELPPGLVNEPYQTILECSSDSPITEWSVGWRYANEEPSAIREGLPAGLELKNVEGSTVSKYIATDELTEQGHYIITVTVKNAVSSHTKSFDLDIYDQTLPEMTELKWKDAGGKIYTVWTPLQKTTAESIDYTIRIYDEEGNLVGEDDKKLPGTETFESGFAELDVTEIIENAGKGIYTFTVTAESDGYASSYANSAAFEKGTYAYGYEDYTIVATAEGTGYGKISLSDASYDIESLEDKSITGGLEVTVREGAVTPDSPLTFVFTPDAGCEITSLTVDGNLITEKNLERYTFTDLPESTDESTVYDREIIVEFSLVDNSIGGEIVETTSYEQGESIDFEAIGHNMDAVGEASDDTRWVPKYWSIDKAADAAVTHHWDSDPYTDTIDTTNLKLGDHTLYVTFQQQRYVAGAGWQDVEGSHAVDVRSVEFTVTDKSGNVPDDSSGDGTSGDGTSGDGTSGGASSGSSGTSGGSSSGGSGSVMDTVTSLLSGVDTSDNMMLGLWSALALVSLCGIGFCIRQMFKYA